MKILIIFWAGVLVAGSIYLDLSRVEAKQLPVSQRSDLAVPTNSDSDGQRVSAVSATAPPAAATGQCPNMIENGGFEEERAWWRDPGGRVFYDTRAAYTGNQAMTINTTNYAGGPSLGFWQRLTLPANTSSLTLDFESIIMSGDVDTNVYLKITDADFQLLQSLVLTYPCACEWQHFAPTLNLASLAGRTVNVWIDVEVDGAIDEVAFDDIKLGVCQSGPTATPIPRPILLHPSGEIFTDQPTFSWEALPGATEYLLWVNQYGPPRENGKVNQSYTSAAANCVVSVCAVIPDVHFVNGAGEWWITAYFDGGLIASESLGNSFTVNLNATPTSTPTPTLTPTTPPLATPTTTSTPATTNVPTTTNTPTTTSTPIATATATGTSSPSATPQATPTVTVPPTGDGDRFERDDDCTLARALATDGIPQEHTFHTQGDADWLHFSVTAGSAYIIEGDVPNASTADLLLAIYGACDRGAIETQDYGFSPDVRLAFTATQSTSYYIRLVNSQADHYGNDVHYQIAVRAANPAPATGMLLIVAGRNQEGDFLQEQIHNVTNRVYRLWRNQGYPANRIRYLATDLNLDPDSDGRADVDGLANNANLREAITEWAAAGLQAGQSLTLYLMDHGAYDKLYLDEPRRERLDPRDLDAWLSTLEAAVPDVQITVIIEACNSGSFIDPPATISQVGRVIVTSASASEPAWTTNTGARFSDALLDGLATGKTLYGAFQEAKNNARYGITAQTAWLDDDGDRVPNDPDDGLVAAQLSFRGGGLSSTVRWQPWTVWAQVRSAPLARTTQPQNRQEIWAEVRDNDDLEQVWAVVYPPSYPLLTTSDELGSGPPPITLQPRGNDLYAGIYGAFEEIGTYRIVIYALDDEALHSPAKEILFENGSRIFLPAVLR